MKRRDFIKTTAAGGAFAVIGPSIFDNLQQSDKPVWATGPLRWAQLAFVEDDPGRCDPDFWLDYFKKIHVEGALLSAGGVVAFYPTEVPLHHRSDYLGNSDLLGYMIEGCHRQNITVCVRTDPHAARQNVYDAHPDWIAVTADGQKRRHWANPELWVTCALGPYNFEFMTEVHRELMNKYMPEGIFSNRWAGSGTCYCEHCRKNFKEYSGGMEIPGTIASQSSGNPDQALVATKYREWTNARLKDLWFLWDKEIRNIKPSARFIPNGYPDRRVIGQYSDIFFVDRQGRSGFIPPWNSGRGAKELRAGGMGVKPLIQIFSVGLEAAPRWKDSVNTDAELKIWVADGIANGMLPCFVKFNAKPLDKRWLKTMEKVYEGHFRSARYLRNTAPMARVAVVLQEQNLPVSNSQQPWQRDSDSHMHGMYHALVEGHVPFEMINADVLDDEHLTPFKLLILPNVSHLSDKQCDQIKRFVDKGGSLLATFETSLYDEKGALRKNFGLSDLFGVSYDGNVEGPMQNSYLRLREDPATKKFHPVLEGLEDAGRIINGIYRVKVKPKLTFPGPVTLVPTYPDLPMEDVYTRIPDPDTRELYLRGSGKSRVAYFPWDVDRSFWQYMTDDHGKLLNNTIKWALNEDPVVTVKAPGLIEITAWRQENSMAVHLVNLTNPMMMKGPFRELIPVDAEVSIQVPVNSKVTAVTLPMRDEMPQYSYENGQVTLKVNKIYDHEIIGLDLG
ncbi:MAG TPA: alpha-amylase family protein [Bacteroidales bacterium]|nr:alpha-amylase family protein [Bacteroidales bacterium]